MSSKIFKKIKKSVSKVMLVTLLSTSFLNILSPIAYADDDKESSEEQSTFVEESDENNAYSLQPDVTNALNSASTYSIEGQLLNTYAGLSSAIGQDGTNYSKLYNGANTVKDDIINIGGFGSSNFSSKNYDSQDLINSLNTTEDKKDETEADKADSQIKAETSQYKRATKCSIMPDVSKNGSNADFLPVQQAICDLSMEASAYYTTSLLKIAGQNKTGGHTDNNDEYRAVRVGDFLKEGVLKSSDLEGFKNNGYYAREDVSKQGNNTKKNYSDASGDTYSDGSTNYLRLAIASMLYEKTLGGLITEISINPNLVKNEKELETFLKDNMQINVNNENIQTNQSWFQSVMSSLNLGGDLDVGKTKKKATSGKNYTSSNIGELSSVLTKYKQILQIYAPDGTAYNVEDGGKESNQNLITQKYLPAEKQIGGVKKGSKMLVALSKREESSVDKNLENALRINVTEQASIVSTGLNEEVEQANEKTKKLNYSDAVAKIRKSSTINSFVSTAISTSNTNSITSWIPLYQNASGNLGDNNETYETEINKWYKEEKKENYDFTKTPLNTTDILASDKKSTVLTNRLINAGKSNTAKNYRLGISDSEQKNRVNIVPLRSYLGFEETRGQGKVNNLTDKIFLEGASSTVEKRLYGNGIFSYFSRENQYGKFGESNIKSDGFQTIGMDNYGNIIIGATGQILVPYWQNYTVEQFQKFKENGEYVATPFYLNNKTDSKSNSDDDGKLRDLINNINPDSKEVKANVADIEKEVQSALGENANINTLVKEGQRVLNVKDFDEISTQIKNGGANGSGINNEALLGIAIIITAQTHKEVENYNKMFLKSAKESSQLYIGNASAGAGGTKDSSTALDDFNASDLLKKIWILLNVGVWEIVRLTVGQAVINIYTNSLSTSSLTSIFYTETIGNSSNFSDLLGIIASVFNGIIGLLILYWAVMFFRKKLSGGKFLMRFLLTVGILLIPIIYSPVIDTIMNKPASLIIGQQLKQTSILDMWATTKNTKAKTDIYNQKFYGFTDDDLEAMLNEKQKDYVIYFKTTENKKGFNIDEIDENTNLSLFDRSKYSAISDKSIGATWGENDLVEVAVSSYDLKEWALARQSDSKNHTDLNLFTYLSTTKPERYNKSNIPGGKDIASYTEYHVDMNKYFNKTQKDLGFEDSTTGYSNITASELYVELYSTLYNSEIFTNLSSLSGILNTTSVYGDKLSQDSIDLFISDLSRTREARELMYEKENYNELLKNAPEALKLYQETSMTTDNKQNLFSPISYKIMSQLKITPPQNDSLGLEEIVKKIVPTIQYGDVSLNGKIYEVNQLILKKYLSTYATVRQSVEGTDENFDSAERSALALESLFTVDDYFKIKLFPTLYEPNTINFDTYLRMAYIPIKDFNPKDAYSQNVATYVTTNYGTFDIILFLGAVVALVVFGLIYLILFSGLMMVYSLFTYIYNFVIKGDNGDDKKATIFGNLKVYGTFALAKAGLLMIFWAMNYILNLTVSQNGGNSLPHVLIYSIVLIVYVVMVIKKVFLPLFKDIAKDVTTMGGHSAVQSANKLKNKTLGSLAKTGLGSALGLGLGAYGLAKATGRTGKNAIKKTGRKVDKIRNGEGLTGRMAKPIITKGKSALESAGMTIFSDKDKRLLSSDLKNSHKKIPASIIRAVKGGVSKSVAPFVAGSIIGGIGVSKALAESELYENKEKVSDGLSVLKNNSSLGMKIFEGVDSNEAESFARELEKQGTRVNWLDDSHKAFYIEDILGDDSKLSRSMLLGETVKNAKNIKGLKIKPLFNQYRASKDLLMYSDLNNGIKLNLAQDNSDEVLNGISQSAITYLLEDKGFKERFNVNTNNLKFKNGKLVSVNDLNLKLKNGIERDSAMNYLNNWHRDYLNTNYSNSELLAKKKAVTKNNSYLGGSYTFDNMTANDLQEMLPQNKIPKGMYIHGNELRFEDTEQARSRADNLVATLKTQQELRSKEATANLVANSAYIAQGGHNGRRFSSFNMDDVVGSGKNSEEFEKISKKYLKNTDDERNFFNSVDSYAQASSTSFVAESKKQLSSVKDFNKVQEVFNTNKQFSGALSSTVEAKNIINSHLENAGENIAEGELGKRKLENTLISISDISKNQSLTEIADKTKALTSRLKAGTLTVEDCNKEMRTIVKELNKNNAMDDVYGSLRDSVIKESELETLTKNKNILSGLFDSNDDLSYMSNYIKNLTQTDLETMYKLKESGTEFTIKDNVIVVKSKENTIMTDKDFSNKSGDFINLISKF